MWWWSHLEISWCGAITAYCLPKQIYEKANSLIQVVLLDISMFFYLNQVSGYLFGGSNGAPLYLWTVSWILMWYEGLCFIYAAAQFWYDRLCLMYDGIGKLLQTHCNRLRWTNSKEMYLQCIILAYYRVRNKLFTLEEKTPFLSPETATLGLLFDSTR